MRNIPNTYFSVVGEDILKKQILVHGTLLIELKLARGLNKAAHIEDIVVLEEA